MESHNDPRRHSLGINWTRHTDAPFSLCILGAPPLADCINTEMCLKVFWYPATAAYCRGDSGTSSQDSRILQICVTHPKGHQII